MGEADLTTDAAIVPDQEEKKGRVKPKGDLPKPRSKPVAVKPPKRPRSGSGQ